MKEIFTIGEFSVYEEVDFPLDPAGEPFPGDMDEFEELRNQILEGTGQGRNAKTQDAIDLNTLAVPWELSSENKAILGGRRMGKFT